MVRPPRFCSDMRNKRMALGMSQERLAAAVGVTRETVRNIERGLSVPNHFLADRIEKELGTIDWSEF